MSGLKWIYIDEEGIDLELVKQIKEVERKRIKEYVKLGKQMLSILKDQKEYGHVKCDIALPCATQNDINLE